MASDSVRRIKVYTRTGDKGKSSLYNGKRKHKSDDIFAALGDTDELNACLGVAREHCTADVVGKDLPARLVEIQSRLLDIGSTIATPMDTSTPEQLERVAFSDGHVDFLEQWIDDMDAHLPPLRNFVLPSGGLASSHLHVARAVCRRAERAVAQLVAHEQAPPVAQRYLNRLSDFLFVASRFAAQQAGIPEQVYQKDSGLASSSQEVKERKAAAAAAEASGPAAGQ